MNLDDVVGFLTIVRTGRLTDAAAELGLAQPTLTRRLHRLERWAGTELFDRAGRTLRLNARGRAFLPYAGKLIDDSVAGRTAIARMLATVRLDFMHSLGTWMVPELLRGFRLAHPGTDVVLHQGAARELVDRVLGDETDLAIVGPRPPSGDDRLGWHPLETQRLAVAFPLDHPQAQDKPIALEDTAEENWVGMLPGYGTRLLLESLAHQVGFTPRLVFESMELSTVAGLVSAGLGVALLPLDDPYLAVGDIVLRPIDPPTYRDIGLVWRADTELAPPAAALRQFIQAR